MTWLKYNDNYAISCYGEIKNIKTNRILKPWNRGDYLAVNIGANNKHIIHRLVAELFLPKIDIIGIEVDHIDRNKHNNSAYNLRWVSKSTNSLNKFIESKPRKYNKLKEHHIIYNNYSYYVIFVRNDLNIRKKFYNLNDAIIERNKIIANYNAF